eukprot:5329303-Prymnesium_polylepis.1
MSLACAPAPAACALTTFPDTELWPRVLVRAIRALPVREALAHTLPLQPQCSCAQLNARLRTRNLAVDRRARQYRCCHRFVPRELNFNALS